MCRIGVQGPLGHSARPSTWRAVLREPRGDLVEEIGCIDRLDQIQGALADSVALNPWVVNAVQNDRLHTRVVLPMPNRQMQSVERA